MRLERSAERDKREIKNNFSADDAQSKAEGIQNRFVPPDTPPKEKVRCENSGRQLPW